MRRRHMPASKREMMTLCGHAATRQEFQRIKTLRIEEVTCMRCLNLNTANINKIEDMDYKSDLNKRIEVLDSKMKRIETFALVNKS
jgi:copper chaperone CopZ